MVEGRMRTGTPPGTRSLARMKPGEKGEVISLEAPDHAGYRRLFALGLVPGATVTLLQRFPTYVFTAGRTTIAVDAGMAEGIWVAVRPSRNRSPQSRA
ncbi:MAG: ferrous iron transport protein A [Bacillota bacterium]|nr:MAG: ferrous iron transport protein A [Bacillota bacterium]